MYDSAANALFFDGHAVKTTPRQDEGSDENLTLDINMQMGWTPVDPDCTDLPYFFGATRNGIRGRDFIEAP